MKRLTIATVSGLLLAFCVLACASAPRGESASEARTTVQVENYNPLAVTVEAVSSGSDRRLGQVETTNSETFTLPATVNLQDLRIRIDPIGTADTYLSDELVFTPGDVIQVGVESNLDLTTVTIR